MNMNKCNDYLKIIIALSNMKNGIFKVKSLNDNTNEYKLYQLNLKQIKDNIKRNKYLSFYPTVEKLPEKLNENRRLLHMDRENLKRKAISVSPKKDRIENDKYFLPPNKKIPVRKTIVLDLDETLVHSTFEKIENAELVFPVTIDNFQYNIYVLIRPHAFEFIEELSKYFEIVIFTASMSNYADPLITRLDINNRCQYRLFREHCTYIDGAYVKDMSLLGRNLRNTIIVDNSPISFSLQESNGIPIKNWYDDKADEELIKLLPILKNLSGFYDVRSEIPKFITGKTFIWNKAYKWMNENYILNNITNEIEEDNIAICAKNYIKTITLTEGSLNSAKSNNSLLTKNNIVGNIPATSPYILNNPNININIINGDYGHILHTEARKRGNSIEIDDYEYKPSYTEAYIPQDDFEKDVKSNLMKHKKNNKSSNLFNLITIPETHIKENNFLQCRKQINKPIVKELYKLFEHKIVTNSSKSPVKSKHLLNNEAKIRLSVDLRTLNINKLIIDQPSKDLSTGNKLKKSFESKLDCKIQSSNNIKSYNKGKSIDFTSMTKDLFKINPIEKLKFVNVKSVYLTGKQKTKSITQNATEIQFTSSNNCSQEYNSLNTYEPINIENILIQDESSNVNHSKSKEKSSQNLINEKTQSINNCITQSNLNIKEVKRLYSGINRKSAMILNDNNKNNMNTGNIKLYSHSNTDVLINQTNKNNLNPIYKNIFKVTKKKSNEVNFNNSNNHKITEAGRKSKIIFIKVLAPSSINFPELKQITMNLRESFKKGI